MNAFLADVLDAHGGAERWAGYRQVEATIVSGGGFFSLKGIVQDDSPRRMTVALHEEHVVLEPFGAADQRSVFTPERIAVEKTDGTVVGQRLAPKDSFAGHQMNTPWDPLQRAYFNGEALWTYFTTPFLLALPGVEVEEIDPIQADEETWRVLRARFPASIETHSAVQEFAFDGEDHLLRRHDYRVNIAGGFPAAQLTTDYVEAGGIRLPTTRRAYVRGPDAEPVTELAMIWIKLSEIEFS
ncbi:hypothetical protein ET445_00330 [Agromyces protaetiae]|uniref:Uncharacterized protein n=1 Tax=Agromyces protaetiae TaxID=2509455 RepID=A0A4P6F8W5_9MICO|nr:hypothetical protein [Agromyces protaetiae]QAY72005.1 hypothetical protein ET445_00330 [Agromyces protaetiae]